MNKTTALTTISGDVAVAAMSLDWQTALETFLHMLSNPRMRRVAGGCW